MPGGLHEFRSLFSARQDTHSVFMRRSIPFCYLVYSLSLSVSVSLCISIFLSLSFSLPVSPSLSVCLKVSSSSSRSLFLKVFEFEFSLSLPLPPSLLDVLLRLRSGPSSLNNMAYKLQSEACPFTPVSLLPRRPHSRALPAEMPHAATTCRGSLLGQWETSCRPGSVPREPHLGAHPLDTPQLQLPTLVYDILPPTTAVADYATGLEKLSANEQFFDDAQTAACL